MFSFRPPVETKSKVNSSKPKNEQEVKSNGPVLPLSMRLFRQVVVDCQCQQQQQQEQQTQVEAFTGDFCMPISLPQGSQVSPMVFRPMNAELDLSYMRVVERIIAEYSHVCSFYKVPMNTGVLTTVRYCLPSLKVSHPFRDQDMLALSEILLHHLNGPLKFIQRLDFSTQKLRGQRGLNSHGAFCLAKVLKQSEYIKEVYLERNRVGSFGASAIFLSLQFSNVQVLRMRRCRLGERGALTFASVLLNVPRLVSADLSANYIGYHGSQVIEKAVLERRKLEIPRIVLDLEGNLVFQEIMNGITHGLGVILAFVGAYAMSAAVADKPSHYVVSCGIYSVSLVVLYTSSTLYHSFFSMRNTKWVFEILDKCAIYILITGSYTPFLQIVLGHDPRWSTILLAFLWILCVLGMGVEFALPTWEFRSRFSLAMYLGMGWSAVVCLPEVSRILPAEGMHLMILGGVAYTAGVPFFVRDNST